MHRLTARVFSLAFLLLPALMMAQAEKSTIFILKGGLDACTQRWTTGAQRQPLFKPFGAISIESGGSEDSKYTLFAQAGYHVRGSTNRFNVLFQGGGLQNFAQQFHFKNVALIVGAKQKMPISDHLRYYYFVGIRGDYNIGTNFDELRQINGAQSFINYPVNAYVNKITGGMSIGGGAEFDFGELAGAVLELSVHPDFTFQYNAPPVPNVTDPFNPGVPRTIPQQQIRNVTIELSLGIKLVRKVIYDL